MKYQPQLDKSAPKPEAGGEWTREMDWEICKAANGYAEKDKQLLQDDNHLIGGVSGIPHYSTDLAAVVRAAEKWATGRTVHGGGAPSIQRLPSTGEWMAHIAGQPEYSKSAPLALAKALYAAIRAEKPSPFGGLPRTPLSPPNAPYMRYGCDARTDGPSMAIERDALPGDKEDAEARRFGR